MMSSRKNTAGLAPPIVEPIAVIPTSRADSYVAPSNAYSTSTSYVAPTNAYPAPSPPATYNSVTPPHRYDSAPIVAPAVVSETVRYDTAPVMTQEPKLARASMETATYRNDVPVNRFITPGGNPIDNSQPAFPVYHRKFANPSPLGLMAFATTTYVLSMYNISARGIRIPNVILGLAIGYGGLVQLLAGMWEFAAGNTFAATAFSSYGGFWISFGFFYIPQFGVLAAFNVALDQKNDAVGIYLSAWFIVSVIFFIASLRSSIALSALFAFLSVTFLMLFIGEFTLRNNFQVAGGAFGLATAAIAFYIALSGMLTKDTSHFTLPVGEMARGSARNRRDARDINTTY